MLWCGHWPHPFVLNSWRKHLCTCTPWYIASTQKSRSLYKSVRVIGCLVYSFPMILCCSLLPVCAHDHFPLHTWFSTVLCLALISLISIFWQVTVAVCFGLGFPPPSLLTPLEVIPVEREQRTGVKQLIRSHIRDRPWANHAKSLKYYFCSI